MIHTIYKIPAPDSMHQVIEIYGDRAQAWYEYRVLDGTTGAVILDTASEGSFGRQYGQPEIALRDALMHCTGMADGYTQDAERRAVERSDTH